ncbi:MAG: indolepyruvate oxidoreductase, partial [Lentisphaerae bacterium]|nr:indolepyruvate oxidoreductase [Lentisphaerota bacterium]
MKTDIVLAGVGGQGILTIAAIIGQAAVSQGIQVKQSEVHGMAQRGGSVVAHLRLSNA